MKHQNKDYPSLLQTELLDFKAEKVAESAARKSNFSCDLGVPADRRSLFAARQKAEETNGPALAWGYLLVTTGKLGTLWSTAAALIECLSKGQRYRCWNQVNWTRSGGSQSRFENRSLRWSQSVFIQWDSHRSCNHSYAESGCRPLWKLRSQKSEAHSTVM